MCGKYSIKASFTSHLSHLASTIYHIPWGNPMYLLEFKTLWRAWHVKCSQSMQIRDITHNEHCMDLRLGTLYSVDRGPGESGTQGPRIKRPGTQGPETHGPELVHTVQVHT